ncbi:sulfatase [Haloarcula sp. 1CSR25-25]|uniref:sulfatase n=1 Tax=Haloarcula sp. 1CSR25-25 TaxID=2862545 RepID=UPI002894A5C8|nr:sulfatase [Haloarcula sp. 1CSR25-25]MDT3435461.1 sulfatase [Haloarcula sp. 1CSR25-25]
MSHKNVILLTIDALRADHLSCHGYGRQTSPTLDRLASEHLQCDKAISASSHTREAVPALLTGQYPCDAVDESYALATDSIATHLSETPYATGAFHSNPYASRAYGFDKGFDHFYDDLYFGGNKAIALLQGVLNKFRDHLYATAEQINERALDWLDSQSRPVFVWNHYMDVHGPYKPPTTYRGLFSDQAKTNSNPKKLYERAAVTDPEGITPAERQELVNRYDEEIRYVDDSIDDFLSSLREGGYLEDALLIITADHGEAFGESNFYGHPRYLTDELVHVPMIASLPSESADSLDVPVSTLDVAPTILKHVGVTDFEGPGTPLQTLARHPNQFRDRRVFSTARGENEHSNRRRFSVRTTHGQCFLERNRTTGQVLSVRTKGEESSLETELREFSGMKLSEETAEGRERETLSNEVERRLEGLGYK